MQNRDIVKENSLYITSLRLLYLDFTDTCHPGYSGQIEQGIECFAIIFLTISSTKYVCEMIYIVAYFKRIWKKEMKEA